MRGSGHKAQWSGIPYDCKYRKDESKTLCGVFLETLDKPEPRVMGGDEENIFKLKLSKSGGAEIQAGKDLRGQNKKENKLPLN